jgi:hypothetical protein
MFDAITVSSMPAGAQAYAGYVDGAWQTYPHLPAGGHHLSIAVFAADNAEVLDDEPGDATNADCPAWYRREVSLGHVRPCVYTSASNSQALISTLAGAGIARSAYRLWSAHYTYTAHICAPGVCGYPEADGTQWTDRSQGRSLDESLLRDDFFGAAPPPPPTSEDSDMVTLLPGKDATVVCVSVDRSKHSHIWFLADLGLTSATVLEVRIAQHYADNRGWKVDNYAITEAAPNAGFALDEGVDGVSFKRLDDVQLTLCPVFV